MSDSLPDVQFGNDPKPVDWRKKVDLLADKDDDSELLITSRDVIDILGFDPKEI